MSSEKRKFKYRLSGFEQMWDEIERLEKREQLLIYHLDKMAKVCNGEIKGDPTAVFQSALDRLVAIPSKSAGFKIIENMGLEFYDHLQETVTKKDK